MDVLGAWGLSDASLVELSSGATNRTWRAELGAQTWFLRCYRSDDAAAARREHSLIRQVEQSGVATPLPLDALDGHSVVLHDDELFALFPAAAGRQLEPEHLTTRHASSAGAALAGVHDATADVVADGFRQPELRWDGKAWAERIRETARQIPRSSGDPTDRWASERSLDQAAWLGSAECAHAYEPMTASQVIHGDYQHANLFFDGAGVSAVIDWDTAAVMPPGFEVARACSFMFHLEVDRSRAFIDGYRAKRDLSDRALEDGARAWGCFADHHVWPTEERYRNGNLAAARFIPHRPFVPFAHAWAAIVTP